MGDELKPAPAEAGVRALYRPGREPAPDGDGLPQGRGAAAKEREEIIKFLGETIPSRSRFTTDEDHMARVEDEARAMTLSERVYLEIAMLERGRASYSSDYDPLRY